MSALSSLFARRRPPEPAALYASLVAQARLPVFYTDYGVPDTVEGRFDMIVLHAWMLFRRLGREGARGRALAQETFDLFFADMDGSLREMGVGDLSVPRTIKRMAEAFYGRVAAYDAALKDEPAALERALARNVLGEEGRAGEARLLAAYVRAMLKVFEEADPAALFDGRLGLPCPAAACQGGS